jgi:hypothetical protein
MARARHALWRILAAGFGLAFGIFGSELTFGQLRAARPSSAVLYSIELRNAQGELLASPLVVGEEGRRLHLSLAQEGPQSQPMAMSLDLTPQSSASGLCLDYKLVVDDGMIHQGNLELLYGLRGISRRIRGGTEDLLLSLRAARAHTAEFDQLLQRRYRPAA